jgi:integrase/recombinase XerD
MAVKLHYKLLPDGRRSAWVDINHNGIRLRPSLGIFLEKETTPEAKDRNKELKKRCEEIRAQKEFVLASERYDFQSEQNQNRFGDFIGLVNHEVEISIRKDKRGFSTLAYKLKSFTKREILPCNEITPAFVEKFKAYLESHLNGQTPYDYFKKFKYVLAKAVKRGYFKTNPAADIKIRKGKCKVKDTLTIEEAKLLLETHCPNQEVKRAFLLCIYTGLRFCDVSVLRWEHIKGGVLEMVQSKTNERVTVPLQNEVLGLLGPRDHNGIRIFNLPSHTGCLKNLRSWLKNAGIEKHITWHCARHSFATLLIANDVDVLLTSKLLGHTSLTHTLRYVRVVEEQKVKAVNRIPSIFTRVGLSS